MRRVIGFFSYSMVMKSLQILSIAAFLLLFFYFRFAYSRESYGLHLDLTTHDVTIEREIERNYPDRSDPERSAPHTDNDVRAFERDQSQAERDCRNTVSMDR